MSSASEGSAVLGGPIHLARCRTDGSALTCERDALFEAGGAGRQGSVDGIGRPRRTNVQVTAIAATMTKDAVHSGVMFF
jgi:hypothetical protein